MNNHQGTSGNSKSCCTNCGATLTADDVNGICMQCQISNVEEGIPEPEPLPVKKGYALVKLWGYARWIIIIFCLGVCAYYFWANHDLFAARKPIRNGSYNTDTNTDRCIDNLWKEAVMLQSGKPVPGKLKCPSCGKTYIVEKHNNLTIISCPDPKKHGFSKLSVDSETLVPKLVR